MLDPIITRGNAKDSVKRCIERLTVRKAYHISDISDIQINIAFVNQE